MSVLMASIFMSVMGVVDVPAAGRKGVRYRGDNHGGKLDTA